MPVLEIEPIDWRHGVAIRKVMRSLSEGEGFEVWEAADGAEGVQKAQAMKPDLVILEVLIPPNEQI
jgi:CheY-like chemotaxis protein